MLNVNNKKIRTTLMTVFSKTFNIFYTFFSVPIANFEQENLCWEQSLTEHVSEKRDMRKDSLNLQQFKDIPPHTSNTVCKCKVLGLQQSQKTQKKHGVRVLLAVSV